MTFDFLITPLFIISALLFLVMAFLAVYGLKFALYKKIVILIILLILFSSLQLLQYQNQYQKISENVKEKLVIGALRTVNQLQQFMPDQRIRSNIFFFNAKKGKYYIKYEFNMDEHQDKNIEIPENLGCTGEAWRTKNQVFGDKNRIFEEGPYRIPLELLQKVPEDLEWICSTPIFNDIKEVIAVVNFDGNRKLNAEQIEQIKSHCIGVSEELREIFTKL